MFTREQLFVLACMAEAITGDLTDGRSIAGQVVIEAQVAATQIPQHIKDPDTISDLPELVAEFIAYEYSTTKRPAPRPAWLVH
jgi:hypothetical protein